jgi:hypothetical protein
MKKKPTASASKRLRLASAPTSLKLDLGCGENPKEGFEGVDLYGEKAKHKIDLFKFPWPFKDNSVEEIHCSHFLEHVPAREVEERDLVKGIVAKVSMHGLSSSGRGITEAEQFLGQDMLFAFMDECYRILKPECWMTVAVPSGRSSRAFWDPTHRRFFMQETFLYFSAEWRKIQGLSHYRVDCNFAVDVTHSMPQEEGLRNDIARNERFATLWNVTYDWHARLKKL